MALDPGNSSIRAVFFDLAGTLITVRGGIGAQYSAMAREYGVEADAAAIDGAFFNAFRSTGRMVFEQPDPDEVASADLRRNTGPQIHADSRTKSGPQVHADSRRMVRVTPEVAALEKRFWKKVVRLVFAATGALAQFPPGQFDRYFDRLFDYFATATGWTVFPDVAPVLTDLKRRGLILGLITNFDSRVFKLIEALNLGRFLDSITIPAVAGAAKPEAAIYEYALARHGLQGSEAVQVGDSMRDDVEGARGAGLRGVLIDRRSSTRSARSGQADDHASVKSLEELLPLLRPGRRRSRTRRRSAR